jgi:dihydroflavonol-4-reductase
VIDTPGTPTVTDRVLVTGATGFIAQHCIIALLEAGYRVRGTARAAAQTPTVADIVRPHLSVRARARMADFDVVAADLGADDGWDSAVAGCRFVLHVASPVPRTPPKHEDDLIVPARDGTLRALRAAHAAGVERVVLTSSTSAVIYGHDRDRTFNETDWSNVDDRRIGAYEKSKTLAERAAWDYMASLESSDRMELATINPGVVLGPLLSSDWATSGEVIKKILDRDFPAIPDLNFAPVDVRDVANAHVAALTEPRAAGQRFLCAIENHSLREIARILADHLGDVGFNVPTAYLPSVLMRIVARWDRTARLGLNDLGVPQHVDSTKIRQVLGWSPRGLEEMVIAMADSMIQHGVVTPPRSKRSPARRMTSLSGARR